MCFLSLKEFDIVGSQAVPLTSHASIAIDKRYYNLGSLFWLDIENVNNEKFSGLTIGQDTGGAIKGALRADLFLGMGIKQEI